MNDIHVGDAAFFVGNEVGELERFACVNRVVHDDLPFSNDFGIDNALRAVDAAKRFSGNNEQLVGQKRHVLRALAQQKFAAPLGAEIQRRHVIAFAADVRARAQRKPRHAAHACAA